MITDCVSENALASPFDQALQIQDHFQGLPPRIYQVVAERYRFPVNVGLKCRSPTVVTGFRHNTPTFSPLRQRRALMPMTKSGHSRGHPETAAGAATTLATYALGLRVNSFSCNEPYQYR